MAERDGAIVGHLLLFRRPPDLRVPRDAIDLGGASTFPEARGTGVGRALTAHAIRWAHEHGYPTITTDWRMTNLWASRFWPKRGFRPTFLRLYRSIP
jgi:GNAT superfamily N-acetyltransferase